MIQSPLRESKHFILVVKPEPVILSAAKDLEIGSERRFRDPSLRSG
jgi:hypothetical protein